MKLLMLGEKLSQVKQGQCTHCDSIFEYKFSDVSSKLTPVPVHLGTISRVDYIVQCPGCNRSTKVPKF